MSEQPLEYPPIAGDIPAARAWKDGRRVYVKSASKSKLSDALWEAGFTWDRDMRLHYVGTGKPGLAKLEKVLPVIRETEAYAQRTAEIKAAGHWVKIPLGPGMKAVREKAKELDARFDGDRGEWALPTAEAAGQVAAMAAERKAAVPARGTSAAGAPRRGACDECGKRGGRHERFDSSGIPGVVCDACNREPDYALSFA